MPLETPIQRGHVSLLRLTLCVLLAGLFLYNPFLCALKTSGSSLTVCHPASYRSTVASSELEPLAAPIAGAAAPSLDVAAMEQLISRLADHQTAAKYSVAQETVVSPQTGFCSSLWFRPPPAA